MAEKPSRARTTVRLAAARPVAAGNTASPSRGGVSRLRQPIRDRAKRRLVVAAPAPETVKLSGQRRRPAVVPVRTRKMPAPRIWILGGSSHQRVAQAKTLAAQRGLTLKRVDLSRVVSKYIGETEKNLARLFDSAEAKQWVLFFDEADALFGRRTEVRDSHDRYANQEASYLLQRLRTSTVPVFIASKHKENIDPAFLRRLRYVVKFHSPLPPRQLST